MTTNTADKIVKYIAKNGETTARELINYLSFSDPAVFSQLKKLINTSTIKKSGTPPKVFYYIDDSPPLESVVLKNKENTRFINNNYLAITAIGEILEGVEAFAYFCRKNKLEINKTASEYRKTLSKYIKMQKNGLLDGTEKLKKNFKKAYLDKLFYLDFYSIERFGKTKLGTLLLYAKQSQNRELTNRIAQLSRNRIAKIITQKNIDAIGYIPHTIPRKIQLLKELKQKWALDLPIIKLVKVSGTIPVAQKSLDKLTDRVKNAQKTILVDDKRVFKNILLIDDAVGSGATLNETARKIKQKHLCSGKIIGVAITGSLKDFDVINEI